jgi:hypothetical protein
LSPCLPFGQGSFALSFGLLSDQTESGLQNPVGQIHPRVAELLHQRTRSRDLASPFGSENEPQGAREWDSQKLGATPTGKVVEDRKTAGMREGPGKDRGLAGSKAPRFHTLRNLQRLHLFQPGGSFDRSNRRVSRPSTLDLSADSPRDSDGRTRALQKRKEAGVSQVDQW